MKFKKDGQNVLCVNQSLKVFIFFYSSPIMNTTHNPLLLCFSSPFSHYSNCIRMLILFSLLLFQLS